MKRFFRGIMFFLGCFFFSLIGAYVTKGSEAVGVAAGFSFGILVCNYLDMKTRVHQAILTEKLQNGYMPPE